MRVVFGLVVFLRVGATKANINIGPLVINRKGHHKNKACSGNHFEFQHMFIFQFFCMHIKKKFQVNLQAGQI